VGYHCRDYFVKQWDRFRIVPWRVLAHATHLRGEGTYDETTVQEHLRVTVTVATGIAEGRVRAVNLDYRTRPMSIAPMGGRPRGPRGPPRR
jgi:hypothetical protein